jgi:SpoIID/LytB domain protein
MNHFTSGRRCRSILLPISLLTLPLAISARLTINARLTMNVSVAGSTGPNPALAETSITLDGHGYGHGIGLSQYGALGYAINDRWSADQILDHYYGGTVSSTAPGRDITVRITGLDNQQTAVVDDKNAAVVDGYTPVAGQPATWHSLVAREIAEGHYTVWGRTDADVCPGATANLDDPAAGWTVVIADQPTSVTFRPLTDTSASADPADLLGLCEPSTGRVRSYRGALRAINSGTGANRTVSQVPIEQYLRSVVGGEVSTGWAALGNGNGAQAIRAQAVAARSYGLAENKESYAQTCDDNCQTYRGAAYRVGVNGTFVAQEFPQTDAAVTSTVGVVRRYGSGAGTIAYTMFSSSSGGFTAQNTFGFTPVVDDGDAVAGNGAHSWTATLATSTIEQAYPAIGTYAGITVTSRDGNGEWGGRVLTMSVTGSAGSIAVTGAAFRSTFALKSNWFQLRGSAGQPATAPPASTPSSTPGTPPAGSSADSCGGRNADLIAGTTANSAASRFTAVTPIRLVDTRIGVGTGAAPLAAGCTLEIDPRVGPASTAVVVNVTAVNPAIDGYLTAYPCGADKPLASIVPIVAGRIVPGTAVVPLNGDGKFCVFSSVDTQLVVDLSGVYSTDSGQRYQPIAAQRRYDSRPVGLVPGDLVVRVPIAGSYGIPASATAVAITVHSSNAVADGYITIWPCGADRPTTSVLNTTTGATVSNHTQVGLDSDGAVCMFAQNSMNLILDVSGWFGPTASADFHALMPYRLMDTRENVGLTGAFAAGQNRAITVTGSGGVPTTRVQAIAAEVTSVDAAAGGFITVHPCLTPIPTISMVRNFAHTTAATTVTGIVDGAGRWCMHASTAMQMLIDISGWYG